MAIKYTHQKGSLGKKNATDVCICISINWVTANFSAIVLFDYFYVVCVCFFFFICRIKQHTIDDEELINKFSKAHTIPWIHNKFHVAERIVDTFLLCVVVRMVIGMVGFTLISMTKVVIQQWINISLIFFFWIEYFLMLAKKKLISCCNC